MPAAARLPAAFDQIDAAREAYGRKLGAELKRVSSERHAAHIELGKLRDVPPNRLEAEAEVDRAVAGLTKDPPGRVLAFGESHDTAAGLAAHLRRLEPVQLVAVLAPDLVKRFMMAKLDALAERNGGWSTTTPEKRKRQIEAAELRFAAADSEWTRLIDETQRAGFSVPLLLREAEAR
jgi:hypothetical protein